jgi:hypothetical protein
VRPLNCLGENTVIKMSTLHMDQQALICRREI